MTDHDVIETRGTLRLRIVQDQDPENPREAFDNAAFRIDPEECKPRRATSKDAGPLVHRYQELVGMHGYSQAIVMFVRMVRMLGGAASMDGREVWYALPTPDLQGVNLRELIECERDTYQQYLHGEVYGWIIEERVTWTAHGRESMETWEFVDSCFGMYGYEYACEEGRAEFDHRVEPAKP